MSRKRRGALEAVPTAAEPSGEGDAPEAPQRLPEPKATPAEPAAPKAPKEVLALVRDFPDLEGIHPDSILAALGIARHFQLPLRDGFGLIHAYGDARGRRAVFVAGFRGMANLAKRSGVVAQVDARPVYDRDQFSFDYGRRIISHVPFEKPEDPGQIIGAYAQIVFRDGSGVTEYAPGREVVALYGWAEKLMPKPTADEYCRKAAIAKAVTSSPFDLEELQTYLRAERNAIAGAPISVV